MAAKYELLRETLRERARHDFAPGEKFPTQRALMNEYGASLSTVDRALRELVADGILMRFQGRGTFVREETAVTRPAGNQIALLLARNVTCNAHAFYAEILFEINNKLSTQRAKAVYDFLLGSGLKTMSITYIGYGSSNPIASNATAAGRAQNRRVVLQITANEKDLK